jgi:hypothetical protein
MRRERAATRLFGKNSKPHDGAGHERRDDTDQHVRSRSRTKSDVGLNDSSNEAKQSENACHHSRQYCLE